MDYSFVFIMRRTFRIVVFFFFSDHGACFSLCLCFLVAVPGACVSFFIRLRTFRIDAFGFRHPGAIFFIFSSSRFVRFALLLFFVGSLDVRFELLLFSFAFALERAIFVFLPSRIVLFVFRLFSLYAAVLQGTFHIHPFWGVVFGGRGGAFIAPRAYASFPLPSRGVRFASLCFLPDCVFFYPAGSICRGAKIRCSRSLYASLKG